MIQEKRGGNMCLPVSRPGYQVAYLNVTKQSWLLYSRGWWGREWLSNLTRFRLNQENPSFFQHFRPYSSLFKGGKTLVLRRSFCLSF
jgi:hypothetical protein